MSTMCNENSNEPDNKQSGGTISDVENIEMKEVTDSRPKAHHNKYNCKMVMITSILLLGPLLMGIGINSLGFRDPINLHFSKLHNLANVSASDETRIKNFPEWIWTLGFLYPFGGWFGSIIGAMTVDKYGRRLPSLFFCGLMILGAVVKIASRYISVYVLFISRFFDGIGSSGLMVSCVLLMFEELPPSLVNYFKPMVQISINLGIGFIGVLALKEIGYTNWNLIHLTPLCMSVVLIMVILHLPESPKHIFNTTRNETKTHKAYLKLRGLDFNQAEEEEMKKTLLSSSNAKQMTLIEFFKTRRFNFPTISLIVLHIGQQLSGINAIVAFAPAVLKKMNIGRGDAGGLAIVGIGLLGSIIFAPIVGNKKRKLLWLTGFISMCLSFILCIICYKFNAPDFTKILFLGLFVFMFQIGPGPMVWFISLEMFPSNATGAAQGIAGFFNWFANTLVFFFFPLLNSLMGINSLYIFIGIQIFVIIYSFLFVVETHNQTAEEVLKKYEEINPFK